MSDLDNSEQPAVEHFDRGLLAAATVAFVAVLAAYVILAVTDNDAEGVGRLCVILAGIFGLGTVQRIQHKATRRELTQQTTQLTRISSQTNGELDDRIEQGAVKAIVATGLVSPEQASVALGKLKR